MKEQRLPAPKRNADPKIIVQSTKKLAIASAHCLGPSPRNSENP